MFRLVAGPPAVHRRTDRRAPAHGNDTPIPRAPHRRLASMIAVAAVAPLLAGCPLHAPPVDVAYPDDPRVLNGAWQVHVTGLDASVGDLVYAPAARRLVAWFDGAPRTFAFDEDLGWQEIDVAWPAPVIAEQFDPTLEAFVAVELTRAEPRVRVTPVDGRPASVAAVSVPAGHTVISVARGSGRSFAFTRDGAGDHYLTWWDSVSGAVGGARRVGAAPDGMRASSNGRVLALWDVRGYHALLVDTAAPDDARTLPLGTCRSNGVTEASADGRWFLLADCFGNLRLADLAADDLGSTAIGIRPPGRVAFALDGTEIVWLGADGVVHALDAASRERTELARLGDPAPADTFERWHRHLVVHRAANLLAVATDDGRVHTVGLPGAAPPRPAAALPALDLTGAALDLTAAAIDADGADGYDFAGTFTASGAGATGDTWPLTGYVFAHDLHRYVPIGPAVAPSAAPPPRLAATATAIDPASEAVRFALSFSTTDRHATTFFGFLHDVAAATSYRVRVERAVPPGP
jgi:hypothetical protein